MSSTPACPSKGTSSSPPLPSSPSLIPVTTTMTVTNSSPKWALEYQRWARGSWSLQQILFPPNVMKFTCSFIGAARQSLLLFIKATTPVSVCGERRNNVCMTGGMLLRGRGLCTHTLSPQSSAKACVFRASSPVHQHGALGPSYCKQRRSWEAAGSANVPPCRWKKKQKINPRKI